MSKIIEKIVSQALPPKDTNVGWWNGKELKFYTNGQWKTSGGSSNNKSFLDVLTLIDERLLVLNIYPEDEERPIEDFGISEDLLASIYFSIKTGNDDFYIAIDNIYNKQTGEIYNKGGHLSKYDDITYKLTIYTEDDEYTYDYKLLVDLTRKTGMFRTWK